MVPNADACSRGRRSTEVRRRRRTLRLAGYGAHSDLISVLEQMAPGHERCMYCGDNQGTDIDHFEPLTLAPLRTFAWPNHLLACSLCNSHYKRHIFPRDEGGRPLLLDPTIEDPLERLHLILGVGRYEALSPQESAGNDVFGLNRGSLLKGRLDAYRAVGSQTSCRNLRADVGSESDAKWS
ncbi:HNH endonuclease [Streptomyces sp. NBC_01240]|uniref:HNH endonuclease n=1 Tax=Streptomyces sp. NBC_01240 TaxID=2903793 RepID=UPI002E10F876|nr:HNH endonuclease [Streptomyces sp. NBC_01240]